MTLRSVTRHCVQSHDTRHCVQSRDNAWSHGTQHCTQHCTPIAHNIHSTFSHFNALTNHSLPFFIPTTSHMRDIQQYSTHLAHELRIRSRDTANTMHTTSRDNTRHVKLRSVTRHTTHDTRHTTHDTRHTTHDTRVQSRDTANTPP